MKIDKSTVATFASGGVVVLAASLVPVASPLATAEVAINPPVVAQASHAQTEAVVESQDRQHLNSPEQRNQRKQRKKYVFMETQQADGKPVRWNPCETIKWSFVEGRSRHRKYAAKAFRQVSRINGLQFQRVSGEADIEIRYKGGISLGLAKLNSSGVGGDRAYWTSGEILFNSKFYLRSSPSAHDRRVQRGIVFHEVGHIMGLGHVRDKSDIMHHINYGDVTSFTRGAKAGLRKLGLSQGCIVPSRVTEISAEASGLGLAVTIRGDRFSEWEIDAEDGVTLRPVNSVDQGWGDGICNADYEDDCALAEQVVARDSGRFEFPGARCGVDYYLRITGTTDFGGPIGGDWNGLTTQIRC